MALSIYPLVTYFLFLHNSSQVNGRFVSYQYIGATARHSTGTYNSTFEFRLPSGKNIMAEISDGKAPSREKYEIVKLLYRNDDPKQIMIYDEQSLYLILGGLLFLAGLILSGISYSLRKKSKSLR